MIPGDNSAGPDADLGAIVRSAVQAELDPVLPHVVAALKRDQAFTELAERLRRAEQTISARRERPVAVALLRLLHRLRHLDLDETLRDSLDIELSQILRAAGFEEFGVVGEPFSADRFEALDGHTSGSIGTVTKVYASGLSSFGDIVIRAQVSVAPTG